MIRKAIAVLSAFVFLAGSLALVIAAVLAWLWIIATAAQQTHWIAGVAVFVASLWAGHHYEAWLKTPWQLWYALWSHIDDELERRIR